MRYTKVQGKNEVLKTSKIILGTATFGSDLSLEKSFQMLDYYVKMGGNTIDTARCYANWIEGGASASEKTIGEWMKTRGNRADIVLMTKGGIPTEEEPSRIHEKAIREDLEESLACLQTDCVDIYFLHRDDENVPVEEIIDYMDLLKKEGKIRAFGVSNWKAYRIKQANEYAKEAGKIEISVSQIQWSYADATPTVLGDETLIAMNQEEYLQYQTLQIPIMAFSSQAKGFFVSYLAKGEEHISDGLKCFLNETNRKKARHLEKLVKETGYRVEQLSLAYITCNPLDGMAIIGVSKMEQLQNNLDCGDVEVDFQLYSMGK